MYFGVRWCENTGSCSFGGFDVCIFDLDVFLWTNLNRSATERFEELRGIQYERTSYGVNEGLRGEECLSVGG